MNLLTKWRVLEESGMTMWFGGLSTEHLSFKELEKKQRSRFLWWVQLGFSLGLVVWNAYIQGKTPKRQAIYRSSEGRSGLEMDVGIIKFQDVSMRTSCLKIWRVQETIKDTKKKQPVKLKKKKKLWRIGGKHVEVLLWVLSSFWWAKKQCIRGA